MSIAESELECSTRSSSLSVISTRIEFHTISDATIKKIDRLTATGTLSRPQAETVKTLLRTGVLTEELVIMQIEKLSKKKLLFILNDVHDYHPTQLSVEQIMRAATFYSRKYRINILINGATDKQLLNNMILGARFGIVYSEKIKAVKEYTSRYVSKCSQAIINGSIIPTFKTAKLCELFDETLPAYKDLIEAQIKLQNILHEVSATTAVKQNKLTEFQEIINQTINKFILDYLIDYFTDNFTEAKEQIELLQSLIDSDESLSPAGAEPSSRIAHCETLPSVISWLQSFSLAELQNLFDILEPIAVAYFDPNGKTYSKLRDINFIGQEILAIQSNPSVPKPVAYIFSSTRGYGFTHFETFIITESTIISPIYYSLSTAFIKDLEKIVGPIFSGPYYCRDFEMITMQADDATCGTFALLMIKELLKNDAELLREFDCSGFMAHFVSHIFIVPPQLLRYSHSSRYIEIVKYLVMSDEIDALDEHAGIIPIMVQLRNNSADAAAISAFEAFRKAWSDDFELFIPKRRLMQVDGHNRYAAFRSRDMVRHARDFKEHQDTERLAAAGEAPRARAVLCT